MEPKRKVAGEFNEVPRGGPRPIPQNQPPAAAGAEAPDHPPKRPSPEQSTKRGVKVGWRRSPTFWWVAVASVAFLFVALGFVFADPQVAWVLFGVGISGLAVAAAVAAMVSLRARRRRDERLRPAP